MTNEEIEEHGLVLAIQAAHLAAISTKKSSFKSNVAFIININYLI